MCECTGKTEYKHSCPYQEDINGNHDEEYCNCCDSCQHECCMDI